MNCLVEGNRSSAVVNIDFESHHDHDYFDEESHHVLGDYSCLIVLTAMNHGDCGNFAERKVQMVVEGRRLV